MKDTMTDQEVVKEIDRLKKEKNAIILAHNYQIPEIQNIADVVGDSLELIKESIKTNASFIILSGVYFMAETAKILSPHKKVLLPVHDAGCPMEQMVDIEKLKKFKKENPDVPVVCYIKSSAEVKAESDVCCTSSNAVEVVKSLKSKKVLFIPDKNLGNYIKKQLPEVEIVVWEGFCTAHHRVRPMEVDHARRQHPEAHILVHPENPIEVIEKADFIGSSGEIINYVNQSDGRDFVIGTEMGILNQLRRNNPNKNFYLMSPALICFDMKKNTLRDIYLSLLNEEKEITIEEDIRVKALKPIEKMLKVD